MINKQSVFFRLNNNPKINSLRSHYKKISFGHNFFLPIPYFCKELNSLIVYSKIWTIHFLTTIKLA